MESIRKPGEKSAPRKGALSFVDIPSMTHQSYRDGTKVDAILKQYATKGVNPNDVGLFRSHVANMPFGVADLSYDYQTQLNTLNRVKDYFSRLPSSIRDYFRNDPANMIGFMADPRNKDRCIEFGLFPDPKKPAQAPAAEAPPAPTSAAAPVPPAPAPSKT